MLTIQTLATFLEQFAPSRLAEEWDNVGLLVGDGRAKVRRVMTCLSVTPASAAEAVQRRADLIVTHHPLPFSPMKRLTADTTAGRLLLQLIVAQVAVYSPHTAFDSAQEGINQRLATGLGLRGILPLAPHIAGQGGGRWGWLEEPLALGQLADASSDFFRSRGCTWWAIPSSRSARRPSLAVPQASSLPPPGPLVAIAWSSARRDFILVWKPKPAAWACSCRDISPASDLRSSSLPTC